MTRMNFGDSEELQILLERAQTPHAVNRAIVASIEQSVADSRRPYRPTSRLETSMMPPSFFGSFHHHVRVSLELDEQVPHMVFKPSFTGDFSPREILEEGAYPVSKPTAFRVATAHHAGH